MLLINEIIMIKEILMTPTESVDNMPGHNKQEGR